MLEGIITAFSTLIVIIAVLFAAWWFTKKLASGGSFSPQSRYMKIIDRIPLSQDRFVVLIQVEEKVYMAGVTASQITLLAELDQEPEALKGQPSATPPEINFRELFQKAGRRNHGK